MDGEGCDSWAQKTNQKITVVVIITILIIKHKT